MQKKGARSRAGAVSDRLRTTGASGTGSRSQATRERILDAAERLFAERGFYGVSVRDITGAANQEFTTWNFSPFRNASSVAYAMRSMFSPASFEL